jgi:hypothetical protein
MLKHVLVTGVLELVDIIATGKAVIMLEGMQEAVMVGLVNKII